MEEWKTYKLKEIGEIVGGATPSTKNPSNYDGPIPWITPKDLSNSNERYIFNGERSITNDGYMSCSCKLLPKGTVLFSSRAPIGYVAIAAAPMCTNQGFKSFIPNSKVDSLFMFYLMKYRKDDIANLGSGTTFIEVSGSVMKEFEVKVPNLDTQKRIANVLSSLDDKIELNNRINHNLEEQAQALYKSWFVDFEPFKDGKFVESELGMIPEGWRVGTLSEVSSITMGQSPSGTSFNEAGNGIAFYQGRTEFGFRFPTTRLFTTEPARFAEQFSILLSVRAPVGDINIAKEKCCIGRGLASIHGKYQSFVFYTVESLKPVMNRFNGEGTVFGSINRKELEGLKIVVPPLTIQKEFNSITNIFDREIYNKSIESVTLCHLRDTLLPKLMSGELKINEIDC